MIAEGLVEALLDGVIVVDDLGTISMCNPAAAALFGYAPGETSGLHLQMLLPALDDQALAEANSRPNRTDASARRKDGTLFPAELTLSEFRLADGTRHIVALVQDSSTRQRRERDMMDNIAVLVHELRTPLTSIRGSLGLIAGGAIDRNSPMLQNLVDVAYRNCERLIRLVNTVLAAEQVQSGGSLIDLSLQSARRLVDLAIESCAAYARSLGVTLVVASGEEDVPFRVDPDRFIQILTNLIANALRFSPTAGQVVVSIERIAEQVRISVRDRGDGIPPEFQHRIFQPFFRAPDPKNRPRDGTGLGLSISKSLAERMEGRIFFESVVGQGTVFSVEFPISASDRAAAPPVAPSPGQT